MRKRSFCTLCIALAAALLTGCGMMASWFADAPGGDAATPAPLFTADPANTPMPTRNPAPADTVAPTLTLAPAPSVTYGAVSLVKDVPQTLGETTYTVTVELDEYGWASTRLLAEEDNGWASAVSYEGDFISAFYFETGFGPCILLSVDVGGADAPVTYALDALSLAEGDGVMGYVESVEGSLIAIVGHVDMLGTYAFRREYTVGQYFALVPEGDGLYHITEDARFLVTARELPVQLFVNGLFVSGTLPVGTRLRITATDGGTEALFITMDGRTGRLAVALQMDPWAVLIDGVPGEEWFEELPYSG